MRVRVRMHMLVYERYRDRERMSVHMEGGLGIGMAAGEVQKEALKCPAGPPALHRHAFPAIQDLGSLSP